MFDLVVQPSLHSAALVRSDWSRDTWRETALAACYDLAPWLLDPDTLVHTDRNLSYILDNELYEGTWAIIERPAPVETLEPQEDLPFIFGF